MNNQDFRIWDCQEAFQYTDPDSIPVTVYHFNNSINRECENLKDNGNLKERVRNCCFSEGNFLFDIRELCCLQQIVDRFKQHKIYPVFIERLQTAIDPIFHRGTSMMDYFSLELYMHMLPFLTIKEVNKLSILNSELNESLTFFQENIDELKKVQRNLDFINAVNSCKIVFSSLDELQNAIEPIAKFITNIDLSKLLPKTKYANLSLADMLNKAPEEHDQIQREIMEELNKMSIKENDPFLNFLINNCTNLKKLNVHFYHLEPDIEHNIFNLFPKLVEYKTASSSLSMGRRAVL